MAQSFSTEVVSNSGPFYPITASASGMAEGVISVRHVEAPPAKPKAVRVECYEHLQQQAA